MNLLSIDVTPVFFANLKAYQAGYPIIANEGGTRSSKTFSICQLLIYIAKSENKKVSIVSPSLPHLKKGARRDVLDILKKWHIYNENDFNRTDNIYFFKNGGYIEFFGVDNSGKVRGPGRDILYANECNLLKRRTFLDLSVRTTGTIFIDYNPADEDHWVYDVADNPKNKKIVSTYKNNLANLSASQVREIEETKHVDLAYYNTFALGMRGSSTGKVYKEWKQVDQLPGTGNVLYGLDFGYSAPCALVKVEVHEGAWYAQELIYEKGLTTPDLIQRMKSLRVSNSIPIYCDSAEPDRILELTRAGYNAKKASKNLKNGINYVNTYKKFITFDSVNLLKEVKSYQWIQKDNELTDEVVGEDHALDALRYALYTHYIKPNPNIVQKDAKTSYTKMHYIENRVKRK